MDRFGRARAHRSPLVPAYLPAGPAHCSATVQAGGSFSGRQLPWNNFLPVWASRTPSGRAVPEARTAHPLSSYNQPLFPARQRPGKCLRKGRRGDRLACRHLRFAKNIVLHRLILFFPRKPGARFPRPFTPAPTGDMASVEHGKGLGKRPQIKDISPTQRNRPALHVRLRTAIRCRRGVAVPPASSADVGKPGRPGRGTGRAAGKRGWRRVGCEIQCGVEAWCCRPAVRSGIGCNDDDRRQRTGGA